MIPALLITLILILPQAIHAQSTAPYPPSTVIKDVIWQPLDEIFRSAEGCDNFPMTWADDDSQYTAYGDGWGVEPKAEKKLSLGFLRVLGSPPNIQLENIRSESGEQVGQGAAGKKASGMLMVDGVLYMLVRNADNSQLAWSTDHGNTWQWSGWTFTESFGCPTFLNFGKNYSGARDGYIYLYSHDSNSAYQPADRMVMARVSKENIKQRDAYQFLKSINENGEPVWTDDINQRGGVFHHPGNCYRSGVTYNAGLKRYLWCQILPPTDEDAPGPRFEGGFGIYEAPEPWGPWSTVYFTNKWDTGPGETSSFPTKWISDDGKTAYLVFSGDDYFSVRKVIFIKQ